MWIQNGEFAMNNTVIVYRSQSEMLFDYALMNGHIAIILLPVLLVLLAVYLKIKPK